jgi:uncharacterized surface protein with fasciclin (FAS1) repeats
MNTRSKLAGLCFATALAIPILAHAGASQIWYQQKKAERLAAQPGQTTNVQSSSVVDVIGQQGQFKTFLTALETAGLIDELKQPGPYTVFVPTDEAFAQIPADKLNGLLNDRTLLKQVLGNHIVAKKKYDWDLRRDALKTLGGAMLQVTQYSSPEDIRINEHVEVLETNLRASNGVVHVIDQVMLQQR